MVRACVRILVTLPRLPSLAQENETLHATLIQRQLEMAQLREALRHAQQGELLLKSLPSLHGVVAVVLTRSTIPTQHTIVLDQGTRQGLSLESVIIDASGVVGRVIEVHPSTSVALLLTDPESRVAGLVERSREAGLLVGRGQGQCEFIYLDATADIREGDRIITAGLGETFPKGLLLGAVIHVERDEQAGVASAWVKPAARLGQLEEVLCLPPHEAAQRDKKRR